MKEKNTTSLLNYYCDTCKDITKHEPVSYKRTYQESPLVQSLQCDQCGEVIEIKVEENKNVRT